MMDGKFLKDGCGDNSVSIIFSLEEEVGALAEGLKIFKVGFRIFKVGLGYSR